MLEDNGVRKISHNAKFDLMWQIHAHGGDLPIVRNQQDTMLKSQLAHDYRTRNGAAKAGVPAAWLPNDLSAVLQERLGVSIEKSIDHDTTDWTGDWSSEMEWYMLEDIEYLEPLDDELDRVLRSQGQERASWIENNAVFAHAWMTYNGITPDTQAWSVALDRWAGEQRHILRHLKKYFPDVANFNSVQQVQASMSKLIKGNLTTTKHAMLKSLAPFFPEISAFMEFRHYNHRIKNWGYRKDKKTNSIVSYLDLHVCQICRKFHPDWRQIGTETARMSCANPNLQQIPREAEFRRLFVAAEGCLLASLDYSAIEVVAAAVFANEENLLAACATGDPHGATAAMLVGHPVSKDSPERQNAKIANFGLLFGGGWEGLIIQARDLFDVVLSEQQAKQMIKDYYMLYPKLRITKGWAYDAMRSPNRRLELYNQVGFRRVLQGHDRKPTTWLNTWIQSTAGYGLKSSYPHLMEKYLLPFLCMQVHDELLFEFFEEDAEVLASIAQQCMLRGMKDVLGPTAPVRVDINMAKVWT